MRKIKTQIGKPSAVALDAGYKTPHISKMLIDDHIRPVMPYTRPQMKKGFFQKNEYVYDEYYDCYICPAGQTLEYCTTTLKDITNINRIQSFARIARCSHNVPKVETLQKLFIGISGRIIWTR
ncbi:hypothetical protein J2S00_004015 [Caldalkalibacillus uzonensis]|uniref:Transposase n=1 Tax=Caldalkalibacillus uzonensis TaxID=353224 RepID=A0ABU0CYF8_9BACI|nr:hypothetical protein [Caldalkalibacillus uzonensis]